MNPIFPDGLIVREPSSTAPDFVKCTVFVNVEQFHKWANNQKENISEKGWLAFNIKESKKGGYYAQLDTWKPQKQSDTVKDKTTYTTPEYTNATTSPIADFPDGIDINDIPF